MHNLFARTASLLFIFSILLGALAPLASAQSKPQRVEPKGNDKKNQRPKPRTAEELKAEEEEKKRYEEEKNAIPDEGIIAVDTNIVNVDAVVYN
ncbi:MAG: hypothetical protein HOP17_12365, partial [Acidobacteria bacterium]|nr:hypothetical protein [Acidobacteriota bacterium]